MNEYPRLAQEDRSSAPDETELLRQTAAGNRAAFRQLVEGNQKRVLQLALRLLDSREDAEDVAQEAFLRVYQSAGKFQPHAKFSTWLYRIVVNLCHDQRRKWKWRFPLLKQEPSSPPERSHVETREIHDAVHRAIESLPQRQRTVLVLHRFDALSCREIAQVLEITESAVESMLVRAYASLRRSLANFKDSAGKMDGNR